MKRRTSLVLASLAISGFVAILFYAFVQLVTIQRSIEDVLSEKILFKEIGRGQTIKVDVKGEGKDAEFTFEGIETESLKPAEDDEAELAGLGSSGSSGSSETSV